MTYIEKFISLDECRKCPHFERLKSSEDNADQDKRVMCRFFIDEKIEPFNATWSGVYKDRDTFLVECVKIRYEQETDSD